MPEPSTDQLTNGPLRWKRQWGGLGLLRPGWWHALIAGVLSGAGWVLSYPPVSFWPAVVLIVWPVLRVADRTARRGGSAWHAGIWFAVGSIPAWAWLTRWAAQGAPAGFPLLVAYLSLYSGLMVWVIARCRRAWPSVSIAFVAPVLWVGVEFLRGRVAFDGFPWFFAAHPLIDAPSASGNAGLAWPAMFIGTYAVSGLLVLVVAGLDRLVRGPRTNWLVAWACLVFFWPMGSVLRWIPDDADSPAPVVGIVQTNVPQSLKTGWSTERRWDDWITMRRLLAEAARGAGVSRPDVLLVPETMFPGFVLQEDGARVEREAGVAWPIGPDPATDRPREVRAETLRDEFLDVQEGLGIPLLIGATRFEGFRIVRDGDMLLYEHDRRFNSVFRVEHGRVEGGVYDKRHLTPFGEIMPYVSAWPWLEDRLLGLAAKGMRFDLEEGRSRTVFPIETGSGTARCVTPICFEASISGVCRDLVFAGGERRADVIVNVTNDGWFYDVEGGRGLHELSARWRCVELATPMVRVANTGISGVIDRRGVVVEALEPWRAGVLVAVVETSGATTVYARIGDLLGWISLAGTILGLALTYTEVGRQKSNRTGPG